jgi:RNA polymerase sigma-70 factor (ECF subfamily)
VSDDLLLYDQWRDGDNSAGQQLLQRHFDSIYRFFETKCEAEADELTQATFTACVRSKEQFRKQSSFRTYLFMIARHELYRLLRQRSRLAEKIDFDATSVAEIVTTPGSRLARQEEHRRLLAVLQDLPVEQQTLLELHYWEDMDIAQLAEVFDIAEGAVRTRLTRARKALKERLETRGAPPKALETLETMDEWIRENK